MCQSPGLASGHGVLESPLTCRRGGSPGGLGKCVMTCVHPQCHTEQSSVLPGPHLPSSSPGAPTTDLAVSGALPFPECQFIWFWIIVPENPPVSKNLQGAWCLSSAARHPSRTSLPVLPGPAGLGVRLQRLVLGPKDTVVKQILFQVPALPLVTQSSCLSLPISKMTPT